MYRLMKTLGLLVFVTGINCQRFNCVNEKNNPCLPTNHMYITDHTRSTAYTDHDLSYEADSNLIEGWYRAVSRAGKDMPTNAPSVGQCQATLPIWLNGTLPLMEDGIVERLACGKLKSECDVKIDICVKNCSDFHVYYLPRPENSFERYCFGTEVPCPAGTYSPSGFTPDCAPNIPELPHCINEHKNPCLVGNHLILDDVTRSEIYSNPDCGYKTDVGMTEGWYRAIGAAGGVMPMMPPTSGMCQAESPIWRIGPLPLLGEGLVARTACVRDMQSICADTIHICVKNCGYFNVYHLSRTKDITQRYCFGDKRPRDQGLLHECKEPEVKHQHVLATAIETTLVIIGLVVSVAIIVLIGYKCKKCEKKVASWDPAQNQEQPPPYSEKPVRSSDLKINFFMTSEVTKKTQVTPEIHSASAEVKGLREHPYYNWAT